MNDLILPVSLYGTAIGHLSRSSAGRSLFTWSAEAANRWPLLATVLSQNIRVGESSQDATESFFGALLPEGRWLEQLSREIQVPSNDLVGIFDIVGADLAGALTIGAGRDVREPTNVDAVELAQLIQNASGFMTGGGGSALPGFQRKITLTRLDGRWVAGNGAIASTHILKPVDSELRASVESEQYVLSIGRKLGLTTFDSWVEDIGNRAVLVIQRYDRAVSGDTIERIHQEDFAQALGLQWGGNDKFQSVNSRANLKAIATELSRGRSIFASGESDVERLLRYTVLNVAAGNTDAHAKNFSILRFADETSRLAPLYDAAPLALAYGAGTALAMSIAGESQQPDVTVDHLVDEAATWGIHRSAAGGIIGEALEDIVQATREIPAHETIANHIPGYIRGQAQNLVAGRPARIDSVVPLMSLPRLGTAEPRT